ncbi:hypothetical protein [Acetobacter oryzifermentans]|uniref:Uncharacterized protein n=1 Tax=Acetobacter oryzifermentans TaxID=1633874 RepID=A0ABM6AHB4_9PROT|nr:hypothetical protein [Acetobacter oryzifermentans]ANA13101.1 hypothetical protein WG31_03000 [Acetobacter oryzifermentans]
MIGTVNNKQEIMVASSDMELWKANQAVRLGELRLTAQATALASAQTRLTSMIGWVVASIAIAGGIAFKSEFKVAGCILLGGVLLTGVIAIYAILPLKWAEVGAQPQIILEMSNQTELECQQSIALYYQNAITRNANRLGLIKQLATVAWIILLVTPPCAWIAQMFWKVITP